MMSPGSPVTDLKPYALYKDSGVSWLGRVPEHWEVRRGKSIFRAVDVRSSSGGEELLTVSSERGVVPRSSIAVTMFKAESYVGYKLCWPGDLVINSLWAWARGLGVTSRHGIVSSAYGVYRLRPSYEKYSGFIHELVRSSAFQWELQVRSKGVWISRLQLTDESFLGAPFPLPPLPEQAGIVKYLDHMNRQIRRYILAKQKLIKLLEEQKQAIIQQAVTRGLDPSVRLKPSGVEWLGEVPEHWEIQRLGHVVEMRVSNVDKHTKEGELPVRLCNYVDAYKNERITDRISFMSGTATAEEISRFRLQFGDVLITKDSEEWNDIGVPALVEYAAHDTVCGYHLAILRPRQRKINGSFLLRVLQAPCFTYQFSVSANGVTRYGLSHDAIKVSLVVCPPLNEQSQIVEYLDKVAAGLDEMVRVCQSEISLLREYRTRLIADVVTGKLDVREIVAGLPEEPEDLDQIQEAEAQDQADEAIGEADLDAPAEEAEA